MASDRAIAQAFREYDEGGDCGGAKFGGMCVAINRRAAELDATPPAGAGEAVAFRFLALVGYANAWSRWFGIDELHHYGVDGNLTPGPSPAWSRVEYAYAAPTPLPEAVRELVGKWRAEANAMREAAKAHEFPVDHVLKMCAKVIDKRADELDRALTGGDKQGEAA